MGLSLPSQRLPAARRMRSAGANVVELTFSRVFQAAEGLSEQEQQALEQLHQAANRLMLQKSYAYVRLQWRGRQTLNLTDS